MRIDTAPLRIERNTGAVHVKGHTLVLRVAMPKSEFLDSTLYQHTQSARLYSLENGTGHTFLVSFCDPDFDNVHLRLSFENDRLGCVDFGWGPRITTREWTEERVQADIGRYRAFLIQELGLVGTFPCELGWGRVYAAKDEKAGAPATGIRYTGFEFKAKEN